MALTDREKAAAIVSNGIAVFSLAQERGIKKGASMYDFVLEVAPKEIREKLDAEFIDEVFEYVTSAHGDRQ
ncbi:MAG: hypothetical protein D9C04_01135 [Nitrosopumilus sp. B06]|nr:MAG: hypothetical protein EB828_01560 [Nitrosopumilus sp. D6]RNJ80496.1 MAG: hypothetical protein D9C04_01135 [Nitrosopumilus sp. B06]